MLNKCKQTLSHLLAKCPTRRGDFGDLVLFASVARCRNNASGGTGLCFKCWPRCRRSFDADYDRSKCAKIQVVLFLRLLGCTHSANFRDQHNFLFCCGIHLIKTWLKNPMPQTLHTRIMLNIKIRLWSFVVFRLDLFFCWTVFLWFCTLNLADPSFFRVRLVVCWPAQWGRYSWANLFHQSLRTGRQGVCTFNPVKKMCTQNEEKNCVSANVDDNWAETLAITFS